MNVNRKKIVIYGGGKFGFNAIQKLKAQYNLIIIDIEPNCYIAERFKLKPESIDSVLDQIQKINSQNKYRTQTSMFFILGAESVLLQAINLFFPLYIVPSAPVHVMANLTQQYLSERYPLVEMNHTKFLMDLSKKPENLFQFTSDKPEVYFSYAAWDEICPEHCIGPKKYCIHHKRHKPITISDFIDNIISKKQILHFRSQQLNAGVGGISVNTIKENFLKLEAILQENQSNRFANLYIATSCNCHGVISRFQIEINEC